MELRFALLVLAILGSLMAAGLSSRLGLVARVIQLGLAALLVPIVWSYQRKIYVIIRTLPRDIKFVVFLYYYFFFSQLNIALNQAPYKSLLTSHLPTLPKRPRGMPRVVLLFRPIRAYPVSLLIATPSSLYV